MSWHDRAHTRCRHSETTQGFAYAPKLLLSKTRPKVAVAALQRLEGEGGHEAADPPADAVTTDAAGQLKHGSVVIAAITSCTNTSNPSVMMAAGLLARKAVERGLRSKPRVKTSLAPGSKVVTDYLVE